MSQAEPHEDAEAGPPKATGSSVEKTETPEVGETWCHTSRPKDPSSLQRSLQRSSFTGPFPFKGIGLSRNWGWGKRNRNIQRSSQVGGDSSMGHREEEKERKQAKPK